MQFPLKGTQHQTGWTGSTYQDAPRTIERKRKGRGVDIIGTSSLPTPPSRSTHLPTPETIRRSSRPRKPIEPVASSSTSAHLPTPQTQRTRRKLSPSPSVLIEGEAIPSPSGHTTFYLSSTNPSSSRPEKIRRRPGLTFAQQMGLLTNTNNGRGVGVGVGMGGHKAGNHGKVDQIGHQTSNMTVTVTKADENPFYVSSSESGLGAGAPLTLASPGLITSHRPGEEDFDSDTDNVPTLCSPKPRRSPRKQSPSPNHHLSPQSQESTIPIHFSSSIGLLSPPPTKHAPRIGINTPGKMVKGVTREEAKKRMEREKEMLDYEYNPFLTKPGESSKRSPGPVVNEDLPTVTYVFRGSKKVFANPLYPSGAPFHPAELDPEDDEFEPHPLPQPRLLWPTGPSPSKSKLRMMRTPSPELDVSPPSSPVSTPTTSRRFGKSALSLEHEKDSENHEGVYSDDEGELMMRNVRAHLTEEDHEHEEDLPSRRGLLFGGHGSTKGMKRGLGEVESEISSRGKKSRGLLRL
ncbi:uncharacterized protein IL334_006790 [Kwoniella shivajii]|uniref:Uncharacterized protein n=1 Tax=Kwoniella shivajii TaxID=564305 RepID=A0ABZ1D929_9TREE|nr:hypothetical protein IL334_006790 [Kwoniella shivajii]